MGEHQRAHTRFVSLHQCGAAGTVNGGGGLSILTNHGGTGGQFAFLPGADVAFLNASGSLTINGDAYTLTASIATLASDIAANPGGAYDAAVRGLRCVRVAFATLLRDETRQDGAPVQRKGLPVQRKGVASCAGAVHAPADNTM